MHAYCAERPVLALRSFFCGGWVVLFPGVDDADGASLPGFGGSAACYIPLEQALPSIAACSSRRVVYLCQKLGAPVEVCVYWVFWRGWQ